MESVDHGTFLTKQKNPKQNFLFLMCGETTTTKYDSTYTCVYMYMYIYIYV